MGVQTPIQEAVAILVCQSIEEEMRAIADERRSPYLMRVCSSQCHRSPEKISRWIEEAIGMLEEGMRVFIGYGGCFPMISKVGRDVYRIEASNCAAILLGGNARFEEYSEGSYFLTPHLASHWGEYFTGRREDIPLESRTRQRLSKWFYTIETLVFINTGSQLARNAARHALEFSEVIEKPLKVVEGDLDFLRREYENFCSRR